MAERFVARPRERCRIGLVQGAIATWLVIGMRCFRTILNSHGLTRSLPLPVPTRSKCDLYF